MHRFIGVLGILFVLGMAFLMSNNRRSIRYKTVAWGLGLQIALAFLVMRWTWGQWAFSKLGAGAKWLLDFSYFGSSFVFGELGLAGEIRPVPFGEERLREAAKHGFKMALVPEANVPKRPPEGMSVRGVARLNQALEAF